MHYSNRLFATLQKLPFLFTFFIFVSCQQGSLVDPSLVQPDPHTSNLLDSFPTNLVIDAKNLYLLEEDIKADANLQRNFEKQIKNPAVNALGITPQPLATVLDGQSQVTSEANSTRALALYWLYLKFVTQSSSSEYMPYIEKAKAFLLAWAESNNTNTDHIPAETAYLGFVEGYSLIRNFVSVEDRSTIDSWLIKKSNHYVKFPPRPNNWETARLNLIYFISYTLSDNINIATANKDYQDLLDVNVLEGGKSEDFLGRDAFAYHVYNLLFYGRIFRARFLYEGKAAFNAMMNQKSKAGTVVGDMIDFWEPYVKDRENNVHLEFVNTEWAPDKKRSDYNKPYNPAGSMYAMEELLLAYPRIQTFITAVNSNSGRANMGFAAFLYWDWDLNSDDFNPIP